MRTRNIQGNEKQARATLKGRYVYTISLKELYRPYMSRISYQVPKLIFSRGKRGRLFEGGRLLQILTYRRGANSRRGAYLKLGTNSSI